MAVSKAKIAEDSLSSLEIRQSTMVFRLVGTTPLIMNRMSAKVWHELLDPSPRKNRAELDSTQKHDPLAEYRESVYRCRDEHAPTAVHMPNGSFKKSLASAATDLPGAFKAQVGRLTSIPGTTIHVYGVPQLYTCPVRNSGMNRTPDIRTRAIFPQWACELLVEHVGSLIKPVIVEKLLVSAGIFVGIGDGRPEKGSSSFGRWRVIETEDDEEYADIVSNGGRKQQLAALENPEYYDEDTRECIEWFIENRKRRTEATRSTRYQPKASPPVKRTNGKNKELRV